MKKIDEYKETTNNSVYNKLHKLYNAACAYCGWHRGENATKRKDKKREKEKVKHESIKDHLS